MKADDQNTYSGAAEDALSRLEAAWERRCQTSNRWCLALGLALGMLFAGAVLWACSLW